MSEPQADRLHESKAVVADAIAGCLKTALKVPELIAKGQGESLAEACEALVSRGPLITATCGRAQQLARAAEARAAPLEAASAAAGRLLAASARLEAVLAGAEARLAEGGQEGQGRRQQREQQGQ